MPAVEVTRESEKRLGAMSEGIGLSVYIEVVLGSMTMMK